MSKAIVFPPFRLDLESERLWRGDEVVATRPKTWGLLRYLAEHPGQVVTKDELLCAVWPNTAVAEATLTVTMRELRAAIADDQRAPRYIETVRRRGFRFIAPVQPVSAADTQPFGSTPPVPLVVGREHELRWLAKLFEQALRGHRQVVFLTGEAGIGKTSLADAFVRSVVNRAGVTLSVGRGQCVEAHGEIDPYMPVLEALAEIGRGVNGKEIVAALRQHAPVALAQMPDLLPRTEVEVLLRSVEGSSAARMLRSMADALEAVARTRPLLLILEDLHWSDPSTVDLLAVIAQRHAPARLMLVGTYRPVEAIVHGHPLSRVKAEPVLKQLCIEIPLELLSEHFVHDYVRLRLEQPSGGRRGSEPTAARAEIDVKELARLIHRRTEGNPFFVARVFDYLAAQGCLSREPSGSGLARDAREIEQLIPADVVALVEQQMSTLAPEEYRLLETASVVGMDFSAAVVAAVLDTDPAAVERVCHKLARWGHVLHESGTEAWPGRTVTWRYGFLHVLVRQVLYDRLHATERARIHQRVGRYLEVVHASDVHRMGATLAEHFERGGDLMRAATYLEYAAENARRRCAYMEASRLLQRTREALARVAEPVEEERHWKLLLALGGAHWRAGQTALAHQWFQEALASARRCTSPELLARTVLAYGRTLISRGFDRSDTLLNLTREAAEAVGQREDSLRAQLLSRWAFALYYRPGDWTSGERREQRDALSDEALRLARRLEEPGTLMVVLYNRHWSDWGPDNLEERQAIAAELAALAHRESDLEMLAEAQAFRFCDSLEAGERGSADDAMVALSRLVEELQHPWYRYLTSVYSATRALLTGRFAEAQQCMQQARTLGKDIDDSMATQVLGAQLIAQASTHGRVTALEDFVASLVDEFPDYPPYRAVAARICADLGRLDSAQRDVDQLATNDFGDLRRDGLWLATIAMLCVAVTRCGDTRRAAILYDLLLPHASKGITLHAGLGYLGCVSGYLGILSAALRQWEAAEQHFERALAFEESLGAAAWATRTRYDYAKALLARRRGRDRARAGELLQQAAREASALEMTELAEKCRAAGPPP